MPIFCPRKFTFFPFLILFKRIESIDMTPCVISFLVILVGNEGTYTILDEFEFWPDFTNNNDSSEKNRCIMLWSTLIGSSSFLQVTKTTIHF